MECHGIYVLFDLGPRLHQRQVNHVVEGPVFAVWMMQCWQGFLNSELQ